MKTLKHPAALPELLFANEAPILQDTGAGYRHGQILFANDSRLTETFYSEPLTTYTVGWRDPNNLEDTLEFLAPAVPVGRRFEWKKAANAEEFLSETVDDQRAIGADFKSVEYTQTDVTDKTLNKGLAIIVDLDNVAGPNWEQNYTAKLMRRCLRNEVRRAFAALVAASSSSNKTWNSSADPDQDISSELITGATATGIRPNRILFGDTSWNTRRSSYRAQNNAGGYASASLTPEELAASLMVDRVLVSKERYQSTASAKAEIVSTAVLMYYAQTGVDTEDPSNIKRFVSLHDAAQGGGVWQVYRQQVSAKLVKISVGYYSKIVVTYTGGIRKFVVS